MRKYFVLILPVFLYFSCCKKKTTDANSFLKSEFPIKVGNWWKYKHGDFLSNTTDTIILKIVSNTSNNYLCHIEQNGQLVDSAKMIFNDNQISFQSYNPDYSYFGDFQIFFPLSLGDKAQITLQGSGINDSINVISYTQGYKYLGNAYGIYFLKRQAVSPGYNLLQTLSISKNIGIVENSINYFNGSPIQYQTLQLIDYGLK